MSSHGRRLPTNPQPAKAALAELGISQRQFARAHGIARENLGAVLNGHIPAFEKAAKALMQATGKPIEELFEPHLYLRTHWYGRELRERYAGGDEA